MHYGFSNIITAKNKEELESCLQASKEMTNIVISALNLQDKNLASVLKEMRNENSKLIMLIIPGNITVSACRMAWECGFDYFLEESSSREEILAVLKKAFRIHDENKHLLEEVPGYPERVIDTLKYFENIKTEDEGADIYDRVLTLQKCKDKRLFPFLILLLDYSSEALRERVIFMLGKLNDPGAVEPLVKILSDSTEESSIRTGAIGALKSLGREDISRPFVEAIKKKVSGKRQKRLAEGGDMKQRISTNIYVEVNNSLLYLFFQEDITENDLNKTSAYFAGSDNESFLRKFKAIHINLYFCGMISKNINTIINSIKDKFNHTVLYLNKNKPELNNLIAGIKVPKVVY